MNPTLLVLLLLPLGSQASCPVEDWYVKPNGKSLTRPAYTLVDGGLVKSKERAPVGATCNLMQPTKPSGKDIYASYDGTSTVTLCSKAK